MNVDKFLFNHLFCEVSNFVTALRSAMLIEVRGHSELKLP